MNFPQLLTFLNSTSLASLSPTNFPSRWEALTDWLHRHVGRTNTIKVNTNKEKNKKKSPTEIGNSLFLPRKQKRMRKISTSHNGLRTCMWWCAVRTPICSSPKHESLCHCLWWVVGGVWVLKAQPLLGNDSINSLFIVPLIVYKWIGNAINAGYRVSMMIGMFFFVFVHPLALFDQLHCHCGPEFLKYGCQITAFSRDKMCHNGYGSGAYWWPVLPPPPQQLTSNSYCLLPSRACVGACGVCAWARIVEIIWEIICGKFTPKRLWWGCWQIDSERELEFVNLSVCACESVSNNYWKVASFLSIIVPIKCDVIGVIFGIVRK